MAYSRSVKTDLIAKPLEIEIESPTLPPDLAKNAVKSSFASWRCL